MAHACGPAMEPTTQSRPLPRRGSHHSCPQGSGQVDLPRGSRPRAAGGLDRATGRRKQREGGEGDSAGGGGISGAGPELSRRSPPRLLASGGRPRRPRSGVGRRRIPVAVVQVGEGAQGLGAEFIRWEIAVAAACHGIGVNAFDQPDVQRAKERTVDLLKAYLKRASCRNHRFCGKAGPQPSGAAPRLRRRPRRGRHWRLP